MIKIAVDTGPIKTESNLRGIGAYANNLITSLDKIQKSDKEIKIDFLDFSEQKINTLEQYDVLHYLHFNIVGKDNIKVTKAPFIVTIHDLIPLIYPKTYPLGLRGYFRFLQKKNKLKKATAVITNSNTSKKDIVRFLNLNSFNIYPIYMAANEIYKKIINKNDLLYIQKKYDLPKDFILYVGDVNYNKNIESLVKVCSNLKINLVLVGKQLSNLNDLVKLNHPELNHLKTLNKLIQNSKFVKVLGYVEIEDLSIIFNLARLYCQPSFYEGFGIPVLEAMQCATPVVISKCQALTEIYSDNVFVINFSDSKMLEKSLNEIYQDTEKLNQFSKKGCNYSHNFSWHKNALETIKLYKKYAKK